MICSQEDQPGTSKSTREIARELGINHMSVWNIVKKDLKLKAFTRVPGQILTTATREKRLSRCKRLLRRLTLTKLKKVFFTDEKAFYIDPPVSSHGRRVWGSRKKSTIAPERLIKQRAKFSKHVMVSAGVCFGGKGRLHFVPEQAKVNAECYITQLLPKLLEDCRNLMGEDFIFQQDGAPAHTARRAQDFIEQQHQDFIKKDDWPPNSPDLNPLDFYVWGVMLDKFQKHKPKPQSIPELKTLLNEIWDSLPQEQVQKAILSVRKRLTACVKTGGGHFEHLLP